ncbi:NADH-quinone oxidoreductase subunit J [Pararobbsia silviterrae]|uniref:NADH-quinone oxidoreductase subunit J n=1 Tax=Pararobbsia silviterrae TaxID=1792498 RepID=A0A494YA06_9BURK|nr:NADH-quinone oxidoreductase subunit J [Pararobbsia silviterrae]RKP57465.1 NADH-quinone oxidoreductase subunit J [Pararobbsia silviterrae]
MEFTTVLFYIFAAILVISALRVITAPNPVQAALFLVLSFFNAAAIWMLLQAEFLAILLVLVYVGAVMVLFLFVVMMLDINIDVLRRDFKRFVPIATIIGAIMVIEAALILWHGYAGIAAPVQAAAAASDWSNTRVIGKIMYTDYIFAFEVAGLVLLVAIIAALALTLRHGKDSKRQVIGDQLRVRASERVRVVKMAAEVEAPPTEDTAAPGNAGAGQTN